ncbi:MAG: PH domain-containing protein [Chloroflexota bacterium]
MATEERVVWQGSPSQWLNFGAYLLAGIGALILLGAIAWAGTSPSALGGNAGAVQLILAAFLLVPVGYALRQFLVLKTTIYTVTTERIRIARGIFSKRTDDLELYRVDDMVVLQPFLLRLVGRGDVIAISSDRTTPQSVVRAVYHPVELRDQMRPHIEACRLRKRTRVLDMEDFDAGTP